MNNLISTKEIVKQSEDEFLYKLRDKVIKKFKKSEDSKEKEIEKLKKINDSKVFILRYAIGDDMVGYFTHLNADIFGEQDSNKNSINSAFKTKIKEVIKDASTKYSDIFSRISKRYDTKVLDSDNPTPINTYLCQIHQFPADFSQGFLGYFYPFCQLTKKCFKSNSYCGKEGQFSYETLKECGFWLDSTTDKTFEETQKENKSVKENKIVEEKRSFNVKKKFVDDIKRNNKKDLDNKELPVAEKINILKYYLLSEIESTLFNFGSKEGSLICIPIIRRGQCNTLIFIETDKKLGEDKNIQNEENIINEIVNEINQFYDDQFYFSFFTLLDEESNYAKILAKPEILSKIFNLKAPSSGNDLIELKESEKGNITNGVKLNFNKDTSKVEIEFYNKILSFNTNTFIDDLNIDDIELFLQQFINSLEQVNKVKDLMAKKNLKIAIISILVDSYAHNISAHSLSALKWWFELRHKILDKRFYIDKNNGLKLSQFQPTEIDVNQEILEQLTERYYSALGLTDSIYNKEFFSLFDYLQFNIENNSDTPKRSGKLFSFSNSNQRYNNEVLEYFPESKGKVLSNVIEDTWQAGDTLPISFNPRFPVPFDYALFPFFRFLRDKGAFWSGVTRDMAFGGESKTWYKILWEDFANNPLYLGTIAKSEGITKLKINLAIKYNNEWITGRFVTIDLSLMDIQERIANNPRLEIEYEKEDFSKIKNHLNDLNINIDEITDKERSEIDEEILGILDEKLNEILFCSDELDEDHCEDNQVAGKMHESRCKESKEKHISNKDYSKYAFVRLGKCFTHFREILNQEEYGVFLPGGVVGEHALFTILENSLRNIKHYKNDSELAKIKENGIDFWISIEKGSHYNHKLNNTNTPDQSKKPEELFKVAVWLGHKTSMLSKEDQGEAAHLWEKVTETTSKPLLDNNGNPKMGGNSQDKACAAMLFNNRFISVDDQSEKNIYYPWVHFTTNGKQFPNNNDYNDLPLTRIDCLKQNLDYEEMNSEFLNNTTIKDGYLKKHFYLWKSSDYIIVNKESDLEGENISRFKFVIISDNVDDINKTLRFARQEGAIRLIFNKPNINIKEIIDKLEVEIPKEFNSDNYSPLPGGLDLNEKIKDERLKVLYDIWLRQWGPIEKGSQIAFCKNKRSSVIDFSENHQITLEYKNHNENAHIIKLSHGGGDEFKSVNVRSHGSFWGKYFSEVVGKQPDDLIKETISIDDITRFHSLLFDFAEVIYTKVFIYDNRLKSRMPTNHEKLQVFEKNLNIIVREEEKLGDDSQAGSVQYGLFKKKLTSEIENNGIPHVLIVHLSYIESMGYKESTEGFMNLFIENELSDLINRDNFIFIIVTGRGRNSWKENLKPEYFRNTLFKPVESFIHALESGVSYNDNFDVKHNIIKVIFGS